MEENEKTLVEKVEALVDMELKIDELLEKIERMNKITSDLLHE